MKTTQRWLLRAQQSFKFLPSKVIWEWSGWIDKLIKPKLFYKSKVEAEASGKSKSKDAGAAARTASWGARQCAVRVQDKKFHPHQQFSGKTNQFSIFLFKKNTFEFKGEDCGDAGRTRTLQLRYRVVQWKEKVLRNHCSNIRWHTIFIHAINKRSWSCYSFTQEACQCSTFCAHIIQTIDVPWCETGVWHCSICLRMPHMGYRDTHIMIFRKFMTNFILFLMVLAVLVSK